MLDPPSALAVTLRRLGTVAAVGTLLALLPGLAAAEEIAPGVHLLRGSFVAGTQPDGNTVVLHAPEGLVVIDTGRHAAHTRRIVDHASAAGRPVVAILNSHWHLDHVGGNGLLRGRYPDLRVYATGAIHGALKGFLASSRAQLAAMLADPATGAETRDALRAELALIDAGPALLPDVEIAATGPRRIAGRELELHLERAVTEGDLWLLDRTSGTLVAGDLVTLPAPFFDTACPRRWSEALGRLAAAEWRTLVPGHGAPMDRAAFGRYRAAFDDLLACAAGDGEPQGCVDGWLRDAAGLVEEGDARLASGLVEYYLSRHLRDATRIATLCGAG
jgi:glyoxylase-like metal-dependent hydrolase (beta-lactamase superfamily II)